MNLLFVDTETTGKVCFSLPADDPSQPRLVQFAAILTDEYGREIESCDIIVRPDGYEIPESVAALHGISTEKALEVGQPLHEVLTEVLGLRAAADYVVAHNARFDVKVLRSELARFDRAYADDPDQFVRNDRTVCTMLWAQRSYRLPKWPSLSAAYKLVTGQELIGAHNARHDVAACERIFFGLTKDWKTRTPPMERSWERHPGLLERR